MGTITFSDKPRQKQKIALARACYYNTEFLIADEAAASLDPFAEDAFNKTLLQGHPDQGVLVISHRDISISSKENSTRTFFESISPLESKTTVSTWRVRGKRSTATARRVR